MPSIQYFQKTDNVKTIFSLKPIILGVISSVVVSGLLIFAFAAIFLYCSLQQQFIPLVSKIILITSVFTGGVVSGVKSKLTGWLYGMMTGMAFFFLLILLNIIFVIGIEHSYYIYVVFAACAFVGSVGGIVGINLKPKHKH